jgi:citrate lyase subunit beta/citryl-CoA lyase
MDGKTLIHPAQVEPCNAVFSPSEEEVAWSRKIIAAFVEPENARKGVITVEGRMVERLHLVVAERMVAIAEAIAARQSP